MSENKYDLCIVGGGPAGMTLAAFAARMGLSCVVIDARSSAHSEFRGESIAPDAVWVLRYLGIMDKITPSETLDIVGLRLSDGGKQVLGIDFAEFPYPEANPAEIPQQLLLSALETLVTEKSNCLVYRNTRAVQLLRSQDGTVTGVFASDQDRNKEKFYARLTIGADGRYSTMRKLSGIQSQELALERDFLWFKMTYPEAWKAGPLFYRVNLKGNQQAVAIPTVPNLVRVGINIPKGSLKSMRSNDITVLHDVVGNLIPELLPTVREEIRSWSDTRVLDIFTTYVKKWYMPGMILIGDAAHTLSPVLGQGISHAICDAALLAFLIKDNIDQSSEEVQQVLSDFQKERELSIERARKLQLRQESLFKAKGLFPTLGRRLLYRGMNMSTAAKRKIWGNLYYAEQRNGLIKHYIETECYPVSAEPPLFAEE